MNKDSGTVFEVIWGICVCMSVHLNIRTTARFMNGNILLRIILLVLAIFVMIETYVTV